MKTNLGKIKKVTDLRSVWAHEEYDFSQWLAEEENLALLSDSIGIDIMLEELESAVGGFSVDLYASEEGTGRKIIIENQLEDTNHDHLGKIITYASGKDASVVVWIVKRARDEHRQAIEWLNQHTDEQIGFFLVEIELWQIDDSAYAPMFKVVERPNDWAKEIKKVSATSNATQQARLEYWTAFNNYAFANKTFAKEFKQRKPSTDHGSHELMKRKVITPKIWIGVGYTYSATIPTSKGSTRLISATAVNSLLQEAALPLYDKLADRHTPIRRLAIAFEDVVDEGCEGYDLFTDWASVEREKARERAVMQIAEKYGKNALLRGTSYLDAATQRERNEMIGGHRAGYDDAGRTR